MPDHDNCQCGELTTKNKRCNKCDIIKLKSEYDKNRKTCKLCRKKYNAKYYQTQKDIVSVEKMKNI